MLSVRSIALAGFCFLFPRVDLFVVDFGGSEFALFKSDSRPGVLRLELHGLTNGVRSGVEGCATVCRLRAVVGLLLPEIDTHALSYPYMIFLSVNNPMFDA